MHQRAITPPNKTPTTKYKFQISFFQSYLKNEIFAGTHAAQICRSEDEIPKALLPKINNMGTVNPIKGPATYHAQGAFNIDNMMDKIFNKLNIPIFLQR
jgi:hypothetical protein